LAERRRKQVRKTNLPSVRQKKPNLFTEHLRARNASRKAVLL
jgi:hypothetical protein